MSRRRQGSLECIHSSYVKCMSESGSGCTEPVEYLRRTIVDCDRDTPELGRRRRAGPYGWYVCCIMLLAFAFNYTDRTVISVLVAPLERQFGMSDTMMGALQGAAFAVCYVLFGFPLARVADKGNRRNLLIVGTAVWCLATGCSGLARSLWELFVARCIVAIGESVVMPCAVSLIADYFGPLQRGKAMSVFSLGIYLGSALALGGGGTLLHRLGVSGVTVPVLGLLHPWSIVFIAGSTLGCVLLPLLLTVREPARLREDGRAADESPSLVQVGRELRLKYRAVFGTIIGFALIALAASTLQAWLPTLFVRAHGWNIGVAGRRLGLMTITLAPLGAITGGTLADRVAAAGRGDSKLTVALISAVMSIGASIVLTLRSIEAAEVGAALLYFFVGFDFGIVQAALAELVPNRMRAVTAALYFSIANLLSATMGPLLIGVLNVDVFHSPAVIRQSLRIVAPVAFAAAAAVLAWGRPAVRAVVKTVHA